MSAGELTRQTIEKLARPLAPPARFARGLRPQAHGWTSRLYRALLVVVIVWDIWLAVDGTDGNTWSEVMRAASARTPVLPWCLSAVVAHLFLWRRKLDGQRADAAATVMWCTAAVLLIVGYAGVDCSGAITELALLGLVMGVLFWPRAPKTDWGW